MHPTANPGDGRDTPGARPAATLPAQASLPLPGGVAAPPDGGRVPGGAQSLGPHVLALDLSLTSIGWASSQGDSGVHEPQGRGMERPLAVLAWLDDVRGRLRPDLVVVEGYSFASRGRAMVSLGELGGVVRLHLYRLQTPVVEVPPACRAKLATGKGNASKDAVLVEAVRRLGYEGHQHDEADALWLLQAALIHYGLPGAAELPRGHREALAKVAWPVLGGT